MTPYVKIDRAQAFLDALDNIDLSTLNWSTTASTTQSYTKLSNAWNTTSATSYQPITYNVSTWTTIPHKRDDRPRRRPAPLEFNPYINASDLMAEFIAFVGAQGVRQGEVMGLPVELFIKWLVVRACEADDVEPNVELVVPRRPQPRCLGCQRFMRRGVHLPLHDGRCAQRYFAKVAA